MLAAELTNAEIVDRFLNRIGVSFAAESAGWRATANDRQSEWKCVFRRPGKQWTVRFHMGSAHTEPPTAYDVLVCVCEDHYSLENDSLPANTEPALEKAMERQDIRFREFFDGPDFEILVEYVTELDSAGSIEQKDVADARAALLGEDE